MTQTERDSPERFAAMAARIHHQRQMITQNLDHMRTQAGTIKGLNSALIREAAAHAACVELLDEHNIVVPKDLASEFLERNRELREKYDALRGLVYRMGGNPDA